MKEDAAIVGDGGASLQPVFLDYDAVIAVIGAAVSKTTLWRWEKAGLFPKRVRLNGRIVAWVASEVSDWCEERCAGRPPATEA